jgi:hypothetical protein
VQTGHASVCSKDIDRAWAKIDAKIQARIAVGRSVPQSTIALLHRQPTQNSIAAAEQTLSDAWQPMEMAVAALSRAHQADGANDRMACEGALADVQRMIGPWGHIMRPVGSADREPLTRVVSRHGLSSHFRPGGCKVREVELELSVLYTFRQTGTLGSAFQAFAHVFLHDNNFRSFVDGRAVLKLRAISSCNRCDWLRSPRGKYDTDLARRPRLDTKSQSIQHQPEQLKNGAITGGDPDNQQAGGAQEVHQPIKRRF